jgi:hypothetical protein
MIGRADRTLLIWVLGFTFLLVINGSHHHRVIVGNHPVYKEDPKAQPPRKHGPPPWAPAHGYRAKHRYRYYPSSYVYFDLGRGVYFYYSSGRWQVSAALPTGIRINANGYVTLEMGTAKRYKFHSDVVKKYPPGHQKKKSKGKG